VDKEKPSKYVPTLLATFHAFELLVRIVENRTGISGIRTTNVTSGDLT
jgi:hypothetical protein